MWETAVVSDVTGFVLNRLQYALFHEATQLLEEGVASAEDIDTLVRTTFERPEEERQLIATVVFVL